MAENTRTPVAIRLVRPYENEDQFLANELETVGKTSVILIGAHPRPTGVILRFEVTLAGGATVLRGEGRVLAHKENAFRGQPGLALRFTRLDPKSKALVDRATAIREAKANGDADPMSARAPTTSSTETAIVPPPSEPELTPAVPVPTLARHVPPAPQTQPQWGNEAPTAKGETTKSEESAVAEALTETPAPAPIRRRRTSRPPEPAEQMRLLEPPPESVVQSEPEGVTTVKPPEREEPTEEEPTRPPPPEPVQAQTRTPGTTRTLDAPPDKDAVLSRLRERASTLSSERVAQILSVRT